MVLVIRRFPLSSWSLLVMLMACNAVSFSADIPEKLQEELDRGKKRFEGELKEAQETLLGSFDKKISSARSTQKLTGEEKQQLIANLEAEKVMLKSSGHIPFSLAMRAETVDYLKKVQKSETALEKVYDRLIDTQTKQKNDDIARTLVTDKKQATEPRIVAEWQLTDPKTNKVTGTWTLWSNGSAQGKDSYHTWTVDQRHLAIRWQRPPNIRWTDKIALKADVMQADIVNEQGVTIASAKRVFAE